MKHSRHHSSVVIYSKVNGSSSTEDPFFIKLSSDVAVTIPYTYEVVWTVCVIICIIWSMLSSIWSFQNSPSPPPKTEQQQIVWFSVMNSSIIMLFMTAMIFAIFCKARKFELDLEDEVVILICCIFIFFWLVYRLLSQLATDIHWLVQMSLDPLLSPCSCVCFSPQVYRCCTLDLVC